MPHDSLFPRYPGRKRPDKYGLMDERKYDAVVEPFAGSACFTVAMLKSGVQSCFLADCAPSIYNMVATWLTPELHVRYYQALDYQLSMLQSHPEQWKTRIIESFQAMRCEEYYNAPIAAATSIIVRDLTFGGVIRFRGERMDAPIVAKQFETLMGRKASDDRYQLPQIPTKSSFISPDFREVFTALEESRCKKAVCLIDPPYYHPSIRDAAYGGLKPNDPFWLKLCIDAVKLAMQSEKIRKIYVCNYYSEQLASELWRVAGLRIKSQKKIGTLTRLQRRFDVVDSCEEFIWEIDCRQRKYRQLELPVFGLA